MRDHLNNAARMARHAVCDGFRLVWRDVAEDEVQRRLYHLEGCIANGTDSTPEDVAKGLKVKCVRGSLDPRGSYWSVQVTGEPARALQMLPWHWSMWVTAIHMKVWCDERSEGAHDSFVDAVYNSTGRLDPSFFGNKSNKRSTKNSGHKGVRLGSKKSDSQTVSYKRRGERSGHEARVKGDSLFRIWCECDEAAGDIFPALSDSQLFLMFAGKAARLGFAKFFAELRLRGIAFTDYFTTACSAPEGALAADAFTELDPKEDAMP